MQNMLDGKVPTGLQKALRVRFPPSEYTPSPSPAQAGSLRECPLNTTLAPTPQLTGGAPGIHAIATALSQSPLVNSLERLTSEDTSTQSVSVPSTLGPPCPGCLSRWQEGLLLA